MPRKYFNQERQGLQQRLVLSDLEIAFACKDILAEVRNATGFIQLFKVKQLDLLEYSINYYAQEDLKK